MTNTREDTGYTPINRDKKRVAIEDYGKAAKAQKAKEEIKRFIKSTRIEK